MYILKSCITALYGSHYFLFLCLGGVFWFWMGICLFITFLPLSQTFKPLLRELIVISDVAFELRSPAQYYTVFAMKGRNYIKRWTQRESTVKKYVLMFVTLYHICYNYSTVQNKVNKLQLHHAFLFYVVLSDFFFYRKKTT